MYRGQGDCIFEALGQPYLCAFLLFAPRTFWIYIYLFEKALSLIFHLIYQPPPPFWSYI